MCSSLVSALSEYLASVKFDSTFLKWIWGLIKRTCVYHKWGYFYYSLYFYLQPIFAVIMQKKKKNQPPPNQKTRTTHDPGSALQVAEFSSFRSTWNGRAPHWADLAVSSVCGPSHHQTGAQLCSCCTLRQALGVTGQLTPGKGWYWGCLNGSPTNERLPF